MVLDGWWLQTKPRIESSARRAERLSATRQIEAIVGVTAVGRAASRKDEACRSQLAEMVGHQILRLTHQSAELTHLAIALGELGQQPPAERVAG
jgi:hypothetical protein